MATSTPGDILLDAGTNELEILVFRLNQGFFGVNVAKVREVILGRKPTESPGRNANVFGMINLRGVLVPLVDLRATLGLPPTSADELTQRRVIVTEFNGLTTGFVVDTVDRIHRVSWSQIKNVPDVNELSGIPSSAVSSCTGVIELDDELVLMVDFESIADGITDIEGLHIQSVDNPDGIDRAKHSVVIAEDSPFMRHTMERVLRDSGYENLTVVSDGIAAWNAVEASIDADPISVIITDIEMPQMDGLHLTKRIREHAEFVNLPVVLFSSLVSDDNRKKGEQVGATMQIGKPDLARLVHIVDLLAAGRIEDAKAA
ncbi:MAG: chemotaxis protein [Planctomycetota bacterium]